MTEDNHSARREAADRCGPTYGQLHTLVQHKRVRCIGQERYVLLEIPTAACTAIQARRSAHV